MTPLIVAFSAGILLVSISIVGGGVKIKEVDIPTLGLIPRVSSGVFGAMLLSLCFFKPEWLQPASAPTPPPPSSVGAVIPELDKVFHSNDLKLSFAYPLKLFIVDSSESKNGLLTLIDDMRNIRVKFTKKALPQRVDIKQAREEEKDNLERLGYTVTYVAPMKEENWKNWYVLSGLTNSTVFYFKRYFFVDGLTSVEFTFPVELRPVYDKIIPAMLQELMLDGTPLLVPIAPTIATSPNSSALASPASMKVPPVKQSSRGAAHRGRPR